MSPKTTQPCDIAQTSRSVIISQLRMHPPSSGNQMHCVSVAQLGSSARSVHAGNAPVSPLPESTPLLLPASLLPASPLLLPSPLLPAVLDALLVPAVPVLAVASVAVPLAVPLLLVAAPVSSPSSLGQPTSTLEHDNTAGTTSCADQVRFMPTA